MHLICQDLLKGIHTLITELNLVFDSIVAEESIEPTAGNMTRIQFRLPGKIEFHIILPTVLTDPVHTQMALD